MADTRGLKVNKDIYDFETMIYGTYDSLPSKRIAHNFERLVDFLLTLAQKDVRNLYRYRQKAMERLNSYLALLKWSRSFNIRRKQLIRLQHSKWSQILRFPAGFGKVTIRPSKTRR